MFQGILQRSPRRYYDDNHCCKEEGHPYSLIYCFCFDRYRIEKTTPGYICDAPNDRNLKMSDTSLVDYQECSRTGDLLRSRAVATQLSSSYNKSRTGLHSGRAVKRTVREYQLPVWCNGDSRKRELALAEASEGTLPLLRVNP